MKHKLKVYYSVQYVKEVELEVDEELEEYLKEENVLKYSNLDHDDNSLFYKLQELNEDILSELPIPEIYENEIGDIKSIEYDECSFEIISFIK